MPEMVGMAGVSDTIMSCLNGQVSPVAPVNLIVNSGFETVIAAGPPANFADWTESSPGGDVTVETVVVHSGVNSCKLPRVTASSLIEQTFAVVPGRTCVLSGWSYGDGAVGHAPRYAVRNTTAGSFIKGLTNLPVTAAWLPFTYTFLVPAGCVSVTVFFYSIVVNGTVCYFDDLSVYLY